MGSQPAAAVITPDSKQQPEDAEHPPLQVPWAHAALVLLSIAPLFVPVDTNLNVIATATLTVFIGCRRSVKPEPPEDSMSQKDAMRFPLIGSAVLFSLFLLFKVLPKAEQFSLSNVRHMQDLVNAVLTAYFVVLGTLALTATALPAVEAAFPERLRDRTAFALKDVRVPYLMKEVASPSVTVPEVASGAASLAFCSWYYFSKHWLANNALGLAFSIQGIEHLSLGAVSTGVILLAGLFVYDIFWVFCTPVMVSVAKSFDAPIKLLFKRAGDTGPRPFSMLGLGDVVIPGIFVALLLRYDQTHNGASTGYFYSAFGGYVAGLTTTIVVMNVFNAAQPALLYMVPAVLGAVALHAYLRGEFSQVLHFSEAAEEEEEKKDGAAAGVPAVAAEGNGTQEAKKLK